MSNSQKQPRAKVLPAAEHIVETLRPFCHRIEIAGSLRRRRPMVGDIEIVAIPKRPVDLLGEPIPKRPDFVTEFLNGRITSFVKNGPKFKQFKYGSFMVDLSLPSVETWGEVFTVRTGSHEFNLWLVQTICPARGVRFHQGRLYAGDGRLLDTPEEGDVFKALDLPWIPPEARDDNLWLDLVKSPAGEVGTAMVTEIAPGGSAPVTTPPPFPFEKPMYQTHEFLMFQQTWIASWRFEDLRQAIQRGRERVGMARRNDKFQEDVVTMTRVTDGDGVVVWRSEDEPGLVAAGVCPEHEEPLPCSGCEMLLIAAK